MSIANPTWKRVTVATVRPYAIAFWKRGYMPINARKQEETT
jgi:hypothetical protein